MLPFPMHLKTLYIVSQNTPKYAISRSKSSKFSVECQGVYSPVEGGHLLHAHHPLNAVIIWPSVIDTPTHLKIASATTAF